MAFVTELWQWYLELLERSDVGVLGDVGIFEQNFFSARALGNLLLVVAELSNEGDVASIWDLGWKSLYHQRQQYRFRYIDYELLEPSLHLIRVGHTCLQYLAPADLSTHGPKIWEQVYCAARFLALGELWPHSSPLNLIREWARLFAYLPAIFKDQWSSKVKYYNNDLFSIPKLMLLACGYLVLNGIAHDEIQHCLKEIGIDLDLLISNIQQWLDLVGNQRDIEGWPTENLLSLLRNEQSGGHRSP